jgi:putative ABC transport system permease protein
MFDYYFRLGLRSLRRNPLLTALMVLTLAVGVAASVSTLTILHVMSGDPIPQKSDRLFVPLLDNGPLEGYNPAEPDRHDPQLSYRDTVNLLAHMPGERHTVTYSVSVPIEPSRPDLPVMAADGLAVTGDFFAMFDAPFRYGQAWDGAQDKAGADVVVLSEKMAEAVFRAVNPVGKRMRMLGHEFTVVGVLAPWRVVPKFYRVASGSGPFGKEEDLYLPINSAIRHETPSNGGTSCFQRRGPGWQGLLDSECVWLQAYVETRSSADRGEVQAWLDNYAAEQRKLGRMKRAAPNQLQDVMQWLESQHVVSNDSRLSAWLAFGFLLLCLVNTIGLLLAKFSVRAAEVGIRRALGASRREIFRQFVVESAVVGLAGGVLGLLLALGALALIAMQSKQMAAIAHMDWSMLAFTFVMSVAAAIVAGLLPTWRACQVTPAIQLKSQ